MVSGVAGAGSATGVVGGVVPVRGMPSAVVGGAVLFAARADEVLVDEVLLVDVEWFGVGGTISMNVRLWRAAAPVDPI